MSLILALLLSTLYFLLSRDAVAWGPIAHLDYASYCLQQVGSFAPAVKLVLRQFPFDFLYGALAADITLGKDYVDYVYNCHNWRVGFLILNEANEDRQRACAFGYLSHLAVDIISHNYYVPFKTIRSYPTRTLGHIYWELRFDAKRPKKIWNLARELAGMKFPHNDELFQRVLKRTLFSFKTNKRIFNSVLTLHKFRHWRGMMEKVHEISRFHLTERDMEEYRHLALESAVSFLKDPDKAPCVRVDPTGADKLLYAEEMRRELRRLIKRKFLTDTDAEQFLKEVKTALREAVYHPRSLPTVTDLI